MNIALRSEDWQLILAASTIQQCQAGSDFNDSMFAKHSHEPESSLLVCSTLRGPFFLRATKAIDF
jgi:hypothetical protein